MHPAAEVYQELLTNIDRWFADASGRHPGIVPCRTGCSACCHGPFDVSMADALLLREGLAELPPETRRQVHERSGVLLARMRVLEPGWEAPFDPGDLGEARFDALTERLAADPCPLLAETGRCVAYEYRPLVCRIIGMPMVTPDGDVLENDCPIRDRFPAYAALDPAMFDLEAWEEREQACLEAAALELRGDTNAAGGETVIAAVGRLGD
jgi:Fe-S-cluster containining protein